MIDDCSSDDRDVVLVERGRSWRSDGAEVRTYTCGWNRIVARVCAERVQIRRKRGVVCPGLELTFGDLDRLTTFLRWWDQHRTRWAAFYWTGEGHPPGWGSETAFYQPPGNVPRVRVAMKVLGKLQGEDFTGHDEVVPAAPPERVADVAVLQKRVWRRGERFGDPAGEEIGGIYRCGELCVEADRHVVTVKRAKKWLVIEPSEHRFFERLLAVESARR